MLAGVEDRVHRRENFYLFRYKYRDLSVVSHYWRLDGDVTVILVKSSEDYDNIPVSKNLNMST